MEIPKKLQDEIWDYCRLNNIPSIDEFINKMVSNGFNIEKYGTSPFVTTQYVDPPEPEIIEKIIEKEIIKEVPVEVIKEIKVDKIVYVDKIIEKEVPVEKIVEKLVEKKVYVTDDVAVTELTEKNFQLKEDLTNERKKNSTVITEMENNFQQKIDDLRGKLDEKVDVVVDEKYKGFWEEEIIAHDKTKEEIIKLKDILKHIGGAGSDDNNDIYGDENKSKGRWGGGSNIKGNK
tara:strand:- start:580 stop:1278 length:699 start_codon:yes stop_codon:yes gene_type:complete